MSDVKVAVVGGAGRMGQELFEVLSQEAGFVPTLAVDRNETSTYSRQVSSLDEVDAKEIGGVIDFSLPELTLKTLNWAKKNNIPLVIGTTGLSDEHHQLIKEVGKSAPVLWAPNMSLGVALLGEAMKLLSKANGFDFHINEFHHKHKKDNPSGTAIFLQEKLEEALGEKIPQPTGIRGGGIFGVHQVYAMSEEEVICFEHQALNRRVFAKGAVKALSWLKQQKPGCYSLADMINRR